MVLQKLGSEEQRLQYLLYQRDNNNYLLLFQSFVYNCERKLINWEENECTCIPEIFLTSFRVNKFVILIS